MAEEITAPTAIAASTAAPPVEAVLPSDTAENATQPVAVTPEAAPVEAKVEPTLLGAPKEEVAEPKQEEAPPEVVKPVEPEKIEAPVYEPFTFPEGVTYDEAKLGEFTKSLGEFELLTKAPHDEMQKLGQKMVERHMEEMQRYTDSLTQAWDKQKTDWKDSFLKAPEFANRTETVLNAAIDAISIYAGDDKQQAEFRDLMESTGIGNHPAMIRLLSNITIAKAEPTPLAAPQIAPKVTGSKIERMYGKKN